MSSSDKSCNKDYANCKIYNVILSILSKELKALKAFRQYEKNTVACVLAGMLAAAGVFALL
jgi:hypothetical protein